MYDAKLSAIIDRYHSLQRQYPRPPGRWASPEAHRLYHQSQIERFVLAQAACSLVSPGTQARLDAARREIMAQLSLDLRVETGAYVSPPKRPRAIDWHTIQITPEVTSDGRLAGLAVLRPSLRELTDALKAQNVTLRKVFNFSR